MDIKTLVNITSRAWSLPILASLDAGVPGRQAPLLKATGATRTAFSQSMEHLIEIGLMERNPDHGHPLRPEFRLTPYGQSVAKIAKNLQSATSASEQDLLRRSWTVPVLSTLHRPCQFSEIKQRLVTVSDRALSQSLRTMEDRKWVQRHVRDDTRPPRPIYSAINEGAAISDVVYAAVRIQSDPAPRQSP